MRKNATVYGAYGHTGRFVVAELVKRGWAPILAGRDQGKLTALGADFPGLTVQVATTDDREALDRAIAGSSAIINCAGPFAETAPALVEAAIRAGIHYFDVAAEIEANLDTLGNYGDRAREAGIVVLPAMAFFGGLGDLLATALVDEWPSVDQISIAYGLSNWHPTKGTRAAGQVSRQRRGGRRITFANGRLEYRDDLPPPGEWAFPEPLGLQRVATEFTMADAVTILHHIPVSRLESFMTAAAVGDLIDPETAPPWLRMTAVARPRPSSSMWSCVPMGRCDAQAQADATSMPSRRRWWSRRSVASWMAGRNPPGSIPPARFSMPETSSSRCPRNI